MLNRNLSIRVVGPTIFVSLLLLGSCTVVAAYLYRQQTTTAAIYGENVGSRNTAHDLEITLQNLLLVLRGPTAIAPAGGAGQIDPLHQRIRELLVEARLAADKDQEKTLVTQLEQDLGRYFRTWQVIVPGEPSAHDQLSSAIELLGSSILPTCRELRDFNALQTKESEEAHRATLQWMAWGLAAVGSIGSLAGIFLGYGVARGLRRSIYQLSVRVRDAADKLGQELPMVTLREDGDLHDLQQQMQGMVREIEQVVQRLQQREREVLRAEQMAAVGQVAAGVAHELRNPLTSIKMLVQKNRRNAGGKGLPAENLQIIEQEIRRMERCLQTFLDFARPPKPERQPLDLATLVNRTFTLIEGRARKQEVTLAFRHAAGPVLVDADWEQIQQLLVNLALNALDAMPRGGTLTVELDAPVNGHIELRMLDTGLGISPQLLPRLFHPFVSGKETGLGLGLVVSRRIAEDHGGTLKARNLPDKGACLVFCLPTPLR